MNSPNILTEVRSKLKLNLSSLLELESLDLFFQCEGLNWRNRLLTPSITLQLFILQILHGNTSCSHVGHLSELSFSAAAYCKSRSRIPFEILEKLLDHLFPIASEEGKWRGHRVLLEDGSGCSMPDTIELRKYFGQPGAQAKDCGFPVASILFLFDAHTGILRRLLTSKLRTGEMSRATELHPDLEEGDIIVGDRGFCSFAHIAALFIRNVHFVFRVSASHKIDFRRARRKTDSYHKIVRGKRIKKLGPKDQLYTWNKTSWMPKWISKKCFRLLPDTVVVREIAYDLVKPGFRSNTIILVTTLLDPKEYPKQAIAELYGMRWEVEVNIRHLKTTMGMDSLHCKTVDGVMREIFVFALVYNLVRSSMIDIANYNQLQPKQISFVDTLRWIRDGKNTITFHKPVLNHYRPGRRHPRVIKRRPKAFPRMTTPRKSFKGFNSTFQSVMA